MDTTAVKTISNQLAISSFSVAQAITLLDGGATIPFIARYRKEQTKGLDETQLRSIQESYTYYMSLCTRKETIVASIQVQGKLTDDLKREIDDCTHLQHLEDLYSPYKKRRKTKADVAIENGLEPLADAMFKIPPSQQKISVTLGYLSEDVTTHQDALDGACHIIAQRISDTASYREWVRQHMMKKGVLKTAVTTAFKDKKTKYDMYAKFSEPLRSAAGHRLLAIRRGEKEKVLRWKIDVESTHVEAYLESKLIKNKNLLFKADIQSAIRDSFSRLLSPSLQTECFNTKCEEAEQSSIQVFSKNLEQLLLSPPLGTEVVMGVDPGFRTGSKVAVVDKQGEFLENQTIFPAPPYNKIKEAATIVESLVKRYGITFVAVGNGTASKETMKFIKDVIQSHQLKCTAVMVNESGASVYSASDMAINEYPDLDVTVRGAISIAHRLQDPLSELVKIDPKSIGVGQYQHDVNQTQLKEALGFTTEFVVNRVGVDVNTASTALLEYVSGIGPVVAKHIVSYRTQYGPFRNRNTLLKVPKLGKKCFEQCSGFLRIKKGENRLDDSSIHPESYPIVRSMASNLNVSVADLIGNTSLIEQISCDDYVTDSIGLLTLKDIVEELKKPGLDPRKEFDYAQFDDDIDDLSQLKKGMALEGVVTNVTNFGAFVDIGVHQDGLIHISNLSQSFVNNPHDIVSVGEKVHVVVIDVDQDRNRIQLKLQGVS